MGREIVSPPHPGELRKIERISIESFLYLKELLKNFRRDVIKPCGCMTLEIVDSLSR